MNLLTKVKLSASAMTFLKYLLWTIVAAAIQALIDNLGGFKIPVYYVPIIASFLKSIATFVATQITECNTEDGELIK